MCGILGIVSKRNIIQPMVEGLKKLAYRGYDSSGLATLNNGKIIKKRAKGKIKNLENLLINEPLSGCIGIAHTRWATHGIANEINAHPHATKEVAIVHNGIIENYRDLMHEIEDSSKLKSQTDSEVIAHLITDAINKGHDIKEIIAKLLVDLKGAFALGILLANKNKIIALKKGSPLALGYGENENFIGSDAIGLASFTKKITYLEDGDWAIIGSENINIYNSGRLVDRKINISSISRQAIEKAGYKHFMHKEIHEQPTVIGETLKSFIDPQKKLIKFDSKILDQNIKRLTLVACGTSSYACRIAKSWFEEYSNIPVIVDIASEYRYRKNFSSLDEPIIFISQSGETRDTIACLELAKSNNIRTLSIVNVIDSTIARLSDENIITLAGPEIGVASTKAFTTQLITLFILSISLAKKKNLISEKIEKQMVNNLMELPSLMIKSLEDEAQIRKIALEIYQANDVLYLGRGTGHGLALEGALKLKEISYIHAEGYAAGELKHGPIALIDEKVPVIGVVFGNKLFEKILSNLSEVKARGGKLVCLTDKKSFSKLKNISDHFIITEDCSDFCQPILGAVPIQLLAYHVAVLKGTDVDQPRNLAKSVTVE